MNEYWAPCPAGLESVCADELRAMHIQRVRPLKSGVAFFGSLEDGYRACLWSRTASRILLVLARVDAGDADALYEGVRSVVWTEHMAQAGTLCVDASGTNEALRNTQFVGVRAKDAICDQFREAYGVRPSVDTRNPDIRVNVAIHGTRATVAIDLAGQSLHRRGWRVPGRQTVAPMKEALAAGMLLLSGWQDIARRGGAFIDPLCGSATLAIEAASIAGDVAPGILRTHWGFERWRGHDVVCWGRLLDEADGRAEAGRDSMPPVYASDKDAQVVAIADENIRRSGFAGAIELAVADISALEAPAGAPGLIATNPPYGERMATRSQLPALYAAFASRLRGSFDGWHLAVITEDLAIDAGLGMSPEHVEKLYNGRLETQLHIYHIGQSANERSGTACSNESAAATADIDGEDASQNVDAATSPDRDDLHFSEPNTVQFADRCRKMYRLRRKWARRNGISCYRVYDADLPDYAVAIDIYEGSGPDEGKRWVEVAEYAAPSEIDPAKAQRRLYDVLACMPSIFDVDIAQVFLKVRRHERGGSQYSGHDDATAGQSVTGIISEDYLKYEVNLSDRLDTGIFLDQRLTRELIFGYADRVRFLNLFAYTGTATVCAAAGGAFTTTTVDVSQTYLDWARRNMELNGFAGEAHEYVRADCLKWVNEMRHTANRWDLIYVDPPTFSTGAKMGGATWDVQRDHVELLIDVSRILTREGFALFSCNLRTFKPDIVALEAAGVQLEDITASTIPADFERNPKIHHCYILRRTAKRS